MSLAEDTFFFRFDNPDDGFAPTELDVYEFLSQSPGSVLTAAFRESEHPRDTDGKFAEIPGSGSDFTERIKNALKGAEAFAQPSAGVDRNIQRNAVGRETPESERVSRPLFAYSSGKGPELNASLRKSGGDLDTVDPLEEPPRPSWAKGGANPNDKRIYKDADMMRNDIRDIDAAIADSVNTQEILVHRGIGDLSAVFPGGTDDLVGTEYVDNGFVSTTTSEQSRDFLADLFRTQNKDAWKQAANMRILVPPGVKMGVPAAKINEIMLERGLRYRIVADNGLDENGIRQLDLEVVR